MKRKASSRIPSQNAFEILDGLVKAMMKFEQDNRNFSAIRTKSIKKARAGLIEWGYRADQASDLIDDALDMAEIMRRRFTLGGSGPGTI